MKKISLDNGLSYKDLRDLNESDIDKICEYWETLASIMEDEARERAHAAYNGPRDFSSEANLVFLRSYLAEATYDLVLG